MKPEDSTADHQSHLDNNGYYDVDSNEYIPLRNTEGGLMSGVTGLQDSGDVHVYNKKTDTYHRVIKGTGDERLSKEFAANHNKRIRSAVVERVNGPEPTPQELQRYADRAKERQEEAELRKGRTSSGPILDSDNY